MEEQGPTLSRLERFTIMSQRHVQTLVTPMGHRQCLTLSVVQLKGKHYRRPILIMGVAHAFQHGLMKA